MNCFLLFLLPFFCARKSRVAKLFTPLILEPAHKVQQNPAQLGLLNSTDLTADSVLEHCQGTLPYPQINFANQLMGFVTPWNDKGYQVALDFKTKFSIIVPVWYTVSPRLRITGETNNQWLKRMHAGPGDAPKIIPRVYFDKWQFSDWVNLISSQESVSKFSEACVKLCRRSSFEGVFIDLGSLSFGILPQTREMQQQYGFLLQKLADFLIQFGNSMHAENLEVYMALAPYTHFQSQVPLIHPLAVLRALTPQPTTTFSSSNEDDDSADGMEATPEDEEEGVEAEGKDGIRFNSANQKKHGKKNKNEQPASLDGIMLMTYDYSSSAQQTGPNAPLEWQLSCFDGLNNIPDKESLDLLNMGDIKPVPPEKVFLGLPFYGYDYANGVNNGPIINNRYLEILQHYKTSFTWNAQTHEHELKWQDENGKSHITYYPTLVSCNIRASSFAQRSLNTAIWELGQGLDYFLDAI